MRISINTSPFDSDLFTTSLVLSAVEAFFSLLLLSVWLIRIPFLFVGFLVGFPIDLLIHGAKASISWIRRKTKNKTIN